MTLQIRMLFILISFLLLVAGTEHASEKELPQLSFQWFDWEHCPTLGEFMRQHYKKANVTAICPPFGEWYSTMFTNGFRKKKGADLVFYDSQWLGEAVSNGFLVEIGNELGEDAANFIRIQDFAEYPAKSNKFYGVSIWGDVMPLIYRKDVFQKFNLLPPYKWTQLLEYAKLFVNTSTTERGFVTMWCGKTPDCYDNFITVWVQLAWSFGGEIWDPDTYKIQGLLDSPENEASLEFTRELIAVGGPGAADFGFGETIAALCNGEAAMGTIWMSFAPVFVSPQSCPAAANLTFEVLPGQRRHLLTLGGQGLGVNAFSKNRELAIDLLLWFTHLTFNACERNFVHKSLAEISSNQRVSFPLTQDIWRLPEYSKLLGIGMDELHKAANGLVSARYALEVTAAKQQKIIDTYYPCGPTPCPEEESTPVAIIAGTVVGGTLLFAVIGVALAVIFYRMKQKQKRLAEEVEKGNRGWQIDFSELEFKECIGMGSFGEVYRGSFRGTEVALKRLRTDVLTENELNEFLKEVDVMRALRHPNIVLFMGCCIQDDKMVMVTEYMPRGALSDQLSDLSVNLDWDKMLGFAKDAARGMHYLHASKPPILHRDFKSLNLLIDNKWNCKVSDFGLTVFSDTKARRNRGNQDKDAKIGSIFWMAPEVIKGERFTEKSDVYSYGITLYEIFTRSQPYIGINPHSVGLRVVEEDLRPEIPRDVPAEMAALMRQCWDRSRRPTFAQIMEELEQIDRKIGDEMRERTKLPEERKQGPTGEVVLIFTDVEKSTQLWEWKPEVMREALYIHHRVIRDCYLAANGYEVKTEGDAFMLAFGSAKDALQFLLRAQEALVEASWPAELMSFPVCAEITDAGGAVLFRGLKVRMGAHIGNPNAVTDDITGRTDYVGTAVNKAARIMSCAHGGQVCVSAEFAEACRALEGDADMRGKFKCVLLGERVLRGLINSHMVYLLHHASGPLAGREKFWAARSVHEGGSSSSGLERTTMGSTSLASFTFPNMVIGQEQAQNMIHNLDQQMARDRWKVPFSEITIEEKIGTGNFGEVFRGKWRNQTVAVKKMLRQRLDQIALLEFKIQLNEIALMAELRHPNVLLFMCACVDPPNMCIVTEYMDYGSLKNVLQSGKYKGELTWKLCHHIAKSVANGMAFLHSSNIVHRDLNSANILVDSNWNIKISDFGLSRIKSHNQTMTMCGTVSWTAPEVLLHSRYSEKADVYSYGIVLWEILTGMQPYADLHHTQIAVHVLKGNRPRYRIVRDCGSSGKHSSSSRPSLSFIIVRMSTREEDFCYSPKSRSHVFCSIWRCRIADLPW